MNYFMLDGKKIPMSDETAASLRKEQKIPMIRQAVLNDAFTGSADRIIIKFMKSLNKFNNNILNSDVLILDRFGDIASHHNSKEYPDIAVHYGNVYDNIKTLFEGEIK